MPRGYYGDCRDCVYYDFYYHKINNAEYEYKCDMCREYFSDCYGSTCYLFEDKEDYRQELLNEQKKREEFLAAGIIISTLVGDGEDEYTESYNPRFSNIETQSEFPLYEFLFLGVIGFLMMKVAYIFIVWPIMNKFFP